MDIWITYTTLGELFLVGNEILQMDLLPTSVLGQILTFSVFS